MDTRKKVDFIKNWIQNYVNTMPAKANSLVIGISGGIDSSVSSTLCALTGMKTALGILKESIETKSLIERPDLVSSFEEINSLTGIDMLNELEERYAHN